MKTVNDLTEAELVEMTEAQLENLIDIECAERGIQLLPPEPQPPQEPFIPYDTIAYVVAYHEFQNREDAEAVAAIINGKPRARYESKYPHYENHFVGWSVQDRVHVEEKSILSLPQQLATKAVREKYKTEKDAYDKLYEEYRKILGERAEIGHEVRERHWNALKRQHERDRHRENFAHYLKMADGDKAVAFRFFSNAYNSALLDFPELRDEFAPAAADAEAPEVLAASV